MTTRQKLKKAGYKVKFNMALRRVETIDGVGLLCVKITNALTHYEAFVTLGYEIIAGAVFDKSLVICNENLDELIESVEELIKRLKDDLQK